MFHLENPWRIPATLPGDQGSVNPSICKIANYLLLYNNEATLLTKNSGGN